MIFVRGIIPMETIINRLGNLILRLSRVIYLPRELKCVYPNFFLKKFIAIFLIVLIAFYDTNILGNCRHVYSMNSERRKKKKIN